MTNFLRRTDMNAILTGVLCFALFCIGMFLRVKTFQQRELWVDEGTIIKSLTSAFFLPVWSYESYGELHHFPGLYLSLWPFYQLFGSGKWALALPHLLSSILGYVFLFCICRSMFKTVIGPLVTFALFTFNNELIFHALELRHYAVLPTLALALFYLSTRLFLPGERPSRKTVIFLFCVMLFSSIYHPYGFIIVGFVFLYSALGAFSKWGVKSIWSCSGWWVAAGILIGLAGFVYYGILPENMTKSFSLTRTPVFQFIPNPLVNFSGFLKAVVGNMVGNRYLYILLIGLVGVFIGPDKEEKLRLLTVLVIIPVMFILCIDLIKAYWFLQRQFIWATPFFLIAIGWGWESLWLAFKERRL